MGHPLRDTGGVQGAAGVGVGTLVWEALCLRCLLDVLAETSRWGWPCGSGAQEGGSGVPWTVEIAWSPAERGPWLT